MNISKIFYTLINNSMTLFHNKSYEESCSVNKCRNFVRDKIFKKDHIIFIVNEYEHQIMRTKCLECYGFLKYEGKNSTDSLCIEYTGVLHNTYEKFTKRYIYINFNDTKIPLVNYKISVSNNLILRYSEDLRSTLIYDFISDDKPVSIKIYVGKKINITLNRKVCTRIPDLNLIEGLDQTENSIKSLEQEIQHFKKINNLSEINYFDNAKNPLSNEFLNIENDASENTEIYRYRIDFKEEYSTIKKELKNYIKCLNDDFGELDSIKTIRINIFNKKIKVIYNFIYEPKNKTRNVIDFLKTRDFDIKKNFKLEKFYIIKPFLDIINKYNENLNDYGKFFLELFIYFINQKTAYNTISDIRKQLDQDKITSKLRKKSVFGEKNKEQNISIDLKGEASELGSFENAVISNSGVLQVLKSFYNISIPKISSFVFKFELSKESNHKFMQEKDRLTIQNQIYSIIQGNVGYTIEYHDNFHCKMRLEQKFDTIDVELAEEDVQKTIKSVSNFICFGDNLDLSVFSLKNDEESSEYVLGENHDINSCIGTEIKRLKNNINVHKDFLLYNRVHYIEYDNRFKEEKKLFKRYTGSMILIHKQESNELRFSSLNNTKGTNPENIKKSNRYNSSKIYSQDVNVRREGFKYLLKTYNNSFDKIDDRNIKNYNSWDKNKSYETNKNKETSNYNIMKKSERKNIYKYIHDLYNIESPKKIVCLTFLVILCGLCILFYRIYFKFLKR